jgi:G3E family GTPase
LRARLRALNPRAALMDADDLASGTAATLVNGLYDPATKSADVGRWLRDEDAHDAHHHHDHGHHHDHHGTITMTTPVITIITVTMTINPHDVNRHDASIRSFSIVEDKPIDPMALDMFIDLLRSAHGEKLLAHEGDRLRCPIGRNGRWCCTASRASSIRRAACRPGRTPHDRRTRMVLITKDLPETFVKDLFDAFLGKPRIDTPDRTALSTTIRSQSPGCGGHGPGDAPSVGKGAGRSAQRQGA